MPDEITPPEKSAADQPNAHQDPFVKPPIDRGLRSMQAHPSMSGGLKRIVPGCLVLVTGFLIALIFVISYGVMNWRWVVSGLVTEQMNQGIMTSDLPDQQKRLIVDKIAAARDGFVDESLTYEQLLEVGAFVFTDPGFELGMMYYAKALYLPAGDRSEHDQQSADRALQRFTRGVLEGSIPDDRVATVLASLYEAGGRGGKRLKEDATREEVDAMLERALAAADAASVPDEPYEVDVADHFARLLDQALPPAAKP